MLPLCIFVAVFFGGGLYHYAQGTEFAFYQIKAPVAALPAMIVAVLLARGTLEERILPFLRGVGDINIATMCMVFLLAGAFSKVTGAIGGVDATVALGLKLLPASFLLPGLFLVSGFIATAMGTSMGTVAAIAPVAVGISQGSDISLALCIGAVVGGAMFGDNLSMISDTTIAATRTQGCNMRDKLLFNIRIALPAAIVTLLVLTLMGQGGETASRELDNPILVLPYLLVLGLAVSGINVMVVLMSGIVVSTILGMLMANYSLGQAGNDIYAGFESMVEIMILSMFIGGLSKMMTEGGGKAWLTQTARKLLSRGGRLSQRACEFGIAGLVSICNLFTANNTVAILASGDVARDLSKEAGVDPRRSASLLDIFSCVVQGVIPWGAQILLAGSISGLSPLTIAGSVHYVWILAVVALLAIVTGFPKINKPLKVETTI
ncbi:Na+/H+ antiporter NhaC family protein [Parendozoicomonas haliclonae]|uniref:Malate-2H(+)/Na(+)-lactate antiporter n=2 Tax=Parendozoicomonas haliclonae TaxID=1960125 RepID=A0A1X7AI00_9GAMM|nr:Malate-2H(+)/Na(+)-lactate antiporter [Parendozoicomonas haliclonae]